MVCELTNFDLGQCGILDPNLNSLLEKKKSPIADGKIVDEEAQSHHVRDNRVSNDRSLSSSSFGSDFSSIYDDSTTNSSEEFCDTNGCDNNYEENDSGSENDTVIICNTMSSLSEMSKQSWSYSSEDSFSLSNYIFFDARCDADLKTECEV